MIMVVADTGKRCLTVLGAGASLDGDGRLGVVACPFSPTLLGLLRAQAPISQSCQIENCKAAAGILPNGPRQLFAVRRTLIPDE